MRIAIFCKTFLKGGAEKQALILTNLLTQKGIHVSLINWNGNIIDSQYLKFIEENSFRYFPMKGVNLFKFFQFQRILKEEKVSVVLSFLTLPNFISGISRVFNKKVRVIGGIRNETLPFHKFCFEKWIHNYLHNASVFNNYAAKEKFCKRGFNPDKIRVIHNAIELTSLTKNWDVPSREFRIITVSRFVGQKDFKTALLSFRNLLDRNQNGNMSYIVAGYGPLEKDIKSWVEKLSLTGNVKILINPPDIPGLLSKCDVFLSTSLFEGNSNSIMEAMAAGLPIVATDVGDNRHLVKEGFNGFLVPCKDVNLIVNKLEYLMNSESARGELGKNSRSIISNDFSPEKLLDGYMKLLSEVE